MQNDDPSIVAAVDRYDVILAGAGLIGSTLGIALASAGLKVALVDRMTPAQAADQGFDGRTTAIAYGSHLMLQQLGVWDALADGACAIVGIRVSDGPSLLHLHFNPADLGPAPDGRIAPFGYIVENRLLRAALHSRLQSLPNATLLAPDSVDDFQQDGAAARVTLASGRRLSASLLVVAEGRLSSLREKLGVKLSRFDYTQTAIVCCVVHEQPHNNLAQEKFLPAGPFAILPMADDDQGRHRSSLVWTETKTVAPALLALDAERFARELQRRFGDHLGVVAPIGGRWSFPLSLQHADRYVVGRAVLAGDAAHAIHPIAGQGLNLGLRDAAALAEIAVDAARLGGDIGAADVLARYQAWRRFDIVTLQLATDALNRLFSNDIAPLRLVRDLGLGAVNRIPPLKKFFMRHAMGVLGDLPRLIKGEAL
ncbi:MAG: UbiH/UbiF/VisC/COQ6 family ubiquinone biosynthesis hydroxylase [Rhodospirillales bacterium]